MTSSRIRGLKTHFCLALSTLLLCGSTVQGFVPPHPDSDLAESWEPIQAKRRRLQQSYNYTPGFVHLELCRYMNEEECQDVDESLADHAMRAQRRQQQTNAQQGNNIEFVDHVEDDFSSLRSHLYYPSEVRSSSTSSSPKQQRTPTQTQPMLRRNPSMVKPEEPIIEVLVLLMRFEDHKNRVLPTKADYEALWNYRIHHWFDLNSYGHYRYKATVTDWMDTDDTEEHYAAGVSGLRHSLQESIWPLLDRLNDDPQWDWSKFDRDGDGKLDAVVILHSGYPAEVGGRDCTNQSPVADRIWSHAFASSQTWTTIGILGSADYTINLQEYEQLQETLQEMQAMQQQQGGGLSPMKEGKDKQEEDLPQFDDILEPIYSLHGYLIASGLSGICGANVAKMGVMVHEYMHTLGLDDVYDYGSDSNGKGVGIWDIMGYPYGPANDEDYPGHLSAYSKLSLGWLQPIEWLPQNGTQELTLTPGETSNQAIKIPLTEGPRIFDVNDVTVSRTKLMPQYQSNNANGKYEEYLLLENRQALEYDRDLNNRTGLIIYHVDESVPRMNNRGFPGQNGWPHNGKHYRVSILGADALYHLERGINKGDRGDVWAPGSVLGPGTAFQTLGSKYDAKDTRRGFGTPDVTYPNTDTYQYGDVKETGIYVESLSESRDFVKVRISWRDPESTGVERQSGTESKTTNPSTPAPTAAPGCINLWFWVDVEVQDEQGEHSVVSIHCDDVAKDPDYDYCSLRDISNSPVSEICRQECSDDCHV